MTNEMSPVSMTDKLAEFLLPTEGEIHVGHLALGEMFSMFKALIEARVADDVEAFTSIRNMLTLRNLPLVKTISRRYEYLLIPHHGPADPAIELADLQQEGYIYLMNAIEKFDDTKGFQFSSYAWWAIKRGMERCLGNSRAVRFPTYLLSRFSRLNQVMVDLWQEQQKKPSVSKLARALELTEEKVTELIEFARMYESMCSVDAPLVEDERTTLLDMMPAVEASVENELMRTEITTARDLTVYLLARKCVLSYEDIARVLSFRSPARCEIAMRRIKEQMKKWGREDLWEESPFESLFKSEAEIAAPMD